MAAGTAMRPNKTAVQHDGVHVTQVARQARIVALLATRSVRSQGELASLLAAEGIEVTQGRCRATSKSSAL